MKTAIKIIKRQQKLKEPIKLRVKNLKNGNQSLYLDIYWQGKRTYQFLYLYLVPEINQQTIAQNQEVARQALLIKSRKIIKLLGNIPNTKETERPENTICSTSSRNTQMSASRRRVIVQEVDTEASSV